MEGHTRAEGAKPIFDENRRGMMQCARCVLARRFSVRRDYAHTLALCCVYNKRRVARAHSALTDTLVPLTPP